MQWVTAETQGKRSVIDMHRVIILTNLFEVLKNFFVMKVLWRPLRQDPEGIPQDGDGCHQYNAGEHQGADGIDDLKKRKLWCDDGRANECTWTIEYFKKRIKVSKFKGEEHQFSPRVMGIRLDERKLKMCRDLGSYKSFIKNCVFSNSLQPIPCT